MRATGIVRRIDDLGRIVIPKEIRKSMGIDAGDALELFVDDNAICFKKYQIGEATFRAECAKYVQKHQNDIFGVTFMCDKTAVSVKDDRTAYVTRNAEDTFDLNVAICYAFKELGVTLDNPTII